MSQSDSQQLDVLKQLEQVFQQRKQASPDSSYVASLYHKGLDGILKKVGEEAVETVIAAKGGDHEQIVYEMADLWMHCLVLLAHQDISVQQILAELQRRMGVSGLEEKASRGNK